MRVPVGIIAAVLGCATPAVAQVGPASGAGSFRPPGYGQLGGGNDRLGTYGEIGDRTYGAGARTAGTGLRVSPGRDVPRLQVPLGDYGVTIPVPGGVGTREMYDLPASPRTAPEPSPRDRPR